MSSSLKTIEDIGEWVIDIGSPIEGMDRRSFTLYSLSILLVEEGLDNIVFGIFAILSLLSLSLSLHSYMDPYPYSWS